MIKTKQKNKHLENKKIVLGIKNLIAKKKKK